MKFIYLVMVLFAALILPNCSEANKGANLTTSNTTAINTSNTNTMARATPEDSTPASEIAGGQELYKKNCATCHRDTGTGGKITIEGRTINPDNLTSDRKKNAPDAKFHTWVANGAPDEGMPAFKEKLSDDQITQIIQYIRSDLQKQ